MLNVLTANATAAVAFIANAAAADKKFVVEQTIAIGDTHFLYGDSDTVVAVKVVGGAVVAAAEGTDESENILEMDLEGTLGNITGKQVWLAVREKDMATMPELVAFLDS